MSSNDAEFILPLFKVAIAKGWDELSSPTNLSSLVNHENIKFASRMDIH